MKIKTFQAATMQEALRSIKAELGPDAVILSTKQVKRGNSLFSLLGRPRVEVTAAIDADADRPRRSGGPRPFPQFEGTAPPSDANPADGRFGYELRTSLNRPMSDSHTAHTASSNSTVRNEPRSDGEWKRVMDELKQLRTLIKGVREPQLWDGQMSGLLEFDGLEHFRCSGLGPVTMARMVKEIQQVDAEALQTPLMLQQALHCLLAGSIKVSGPLLSRRTSKKIAVFVGPTGVGKTTTIAKLAAHYRLREGKSVALITLDTYRLAAVEQLRMYANLLGVKLDVALTNADAVAGIARRSQADLILIDTAGRSPGDAAGLQELKQLMNLDQPLEVHLVLSATTREQDIPDGLGGYADLPISHLLFTKLDETVQYGGIFEAMQRLGRPLSYFSLGQRVPEDLETADPERLANLILGDGVIRADSNWSKAGPQRAGAAP